MQVLTGGLDAFDLAVATTDHVSGLFTAKRLASPIVAPPRGLDD